MSDPRKTKRRAKEDEVITIGRYAQAVGISRTTAYVQARSGEIPARWRGGRYEIARADFERLVRDRASA